MYMKHSLRKDMKATLSAMTPQAVRDKSRSACANLVAMPEFRAADVVMAYLPMPEEVDTTGIVMAAWQAGKTVLAPKVSWEHKHMMALEIHSLDSGLAITQQGPKILEPQYGEAWPVGEIDFIIVPALAFDESGNRLGRGMGFYDRFLAGAGERTFTCGLAFAEQVVPRVPTADHDRPVDALVTDCKVLRFDREK